jgi:probable rRNA maturation factor
VSEHRAADDDAAIEVAAIRLDIAVAPAAAAAAPETRDIVARAIRAADEAAGPVEGTIGVLVENDAAIRALNRQWRGTDKPTNVLSFPAAASPSIAPRHLGDIAISYETAIREANAEARPFAHHLAHLAVHGFLHLLGYDHESDAAAEEMEGLERKILARLGIPDPYGM